MATVDHLEVRYRLASTVGAWTLLPNLAPASRTVQIDGLERGVAYQIEARAVAPNGAASAWVQQTHTVADASLLPLQPTDLAAYPVADGVALTWKVASTQRADVQYEVQRTADLSGTPDAGGWVTVTLITALSYTDGITDRVPRWYRVRAVDFQESTTAWTPPVLQHNKAVDDGASVASLTSSITYSSTDTWISINWTVDGYLLDKVSTPFGGLGTSLIAGLSPSTDYNFYLIWDRVNNTLSAVLSGGVGTPPWAHVGTNRAWSAEQMRQGNIALSAGPILMSTIATYTGPGDPPTGGGSGGGDGGCLRSDMLVIERQRGVIRVADVRKGDLLGSRADRWLRVLNDPPAEMSLHDLWAELTTSNGVEGLVVTAGHPFECAETGQPIRAYDLSLQSALRCPTGVCHPTAIRLLREQAFKVPIQLEAPHVFYASVDGNAWVETHNQMYSTA